MSALQATVDRAPRPLVCVIEHLHRNRARADDACNGLHTHAGITLELGVEPDWLEARLPADEEWRIEWSKLYVGLDLAHAFAETGDRRYADTWVRLVTSWIDQVPADHDSTDVAARRIQNLLYSWSALAEAPHDYHLAPRFEQRLEETLAEQVAFVRDNLTAERNHRTLELYALLVVALGLPRLDPKGRVLCLAHRELQANLFADFLEDGVQCEASTHYHLIALRSHLGALANCRRYGIALSDAYVARLHRALDFALACHRPDGRIAMLSDADGGSYADVLLLGADLLGREDLRWAATAGAAGRPPSDVTVSFPVGGYVVQRSGWGAGADAFADERYLVFDCGPVGAGGHGHYDALSIEVAAGGRPLIVDPGRFTYDEGEPDGPNWRRWFKGTRAHNTVCVDALDQQPYRRGKPKGDAYRAELLTHQVRPRLDLVRGRVESPAYDVVHERTICFVDGRYWLVEDRLRADGEHEYDLRFHLAPDAEGAVGIVSRSRDVVVTAPGLALVLPPASVPSVEPGWVAEVYGVRLPAPVVSVPSAGNGDTILVAAIVPTSTGQVPPTLRSVPGPDVTSCHVAWPDGVEEIVAWTSSGSPGLLPGIEIVDSAGYRRTIAPADSTLAQADIG